MTMASRQPRRPRSKATSPRAGKQGKKARRAVGEGGVARSSGRAKRKLQPRKTGARPGGRGAKTRACGKDACRASLRIVETAGRQIEDVSEEYEIQAPLRRSGGGPGKVTASGRGATRRRGISRRTCEALAAVGHPQRARLLSKLLEGPGTYRALQRTSKLKAGPLYHHVNQLRLAGLILPKQRDLYELTRGGRNLILAVMAMGPLIHDLRRRPVAQGD